MSDYKRKLEELLRSGDRDVKRLYNEISALAMNEAGPRVKRGIKKTACYFSAEFLVGRMIYSNLFNLGLLEETRGVMAKAGLDPNMFEQIEDMALGNGGLGRLAACFLDSAATRGLPLDGYGIRYRYGLFKQYFDKGFQNEIPDDWTDFGDPWSVRREEERVKVDFGNCSVWAAPYDMAIIGYGGKTVNTLRLWQAEPLEGFDFALFNEQKHGEAFRARNEAEAISCVLYPNDDGEEGKRLRIKQEYFFTSASLQSIIRDFKAANGDFKKFHESYAVQLNDTHPAVAVPELIRLLTEEELSFAEAFAVARETLAYTNHTVMAEALEKWDAGLFRSVLPEVYPYVVMVQNELRQALYKKKITGAARKAYDIIDDGKIHMARMAVFGTRSVNGVAELHTEILKKDALKEWYKLYPKRFSNKTNGITQRRWLGLCNPELSGFITERIGDRWLTDLSELKRLTAYANDGGSLKRLNEIKRAKKEQLSWHVKFREYGATLDLDSVFDVQVKRLHEYKRQLLNAFSILDIYFSLKDKTLKDFTPMTCLFGAKAAPGYYRAKGIIKLINEIAKLINGDKDVNDRLNVLFVQNYNVSYAEKLIPAADISEQISTAGTEASGTGNMKLMLNGAVTLGTYDGANIEIVREAGEENNFIFGARVEDIKKAKPNYNPRKIYEKNPRIKRVLDTLTDGTFKDESGFMLKDLRSSILNGASWHDPDQYYILLDFEDYVTAKLKAVKAYQNRENWARMCLLNIAGAGFFSSDRTVGEYASEIWGI
ncbi:MAG: glycogen/starch/alpha-glucan phosphorylase [Oscillospiraceae bacterium]|nr:glycogen/starch/alpha-glucan phosphorylase [Oscillospiraceae bacterium]